MKFPINFKLEWTMEWGKRGQHYNKMSLGDYDIFFYDRCCDEMFLSATGISSIKIGYRNKQQVNVFSLEKKGNVYKFYIDGKRMFLTRQSNVLEPKGIVLEVQGEFRLYKIVGSKI